MYIFIALGHQARLVSEKLRSCASFLGRARRLREEEHQLLRGTNDTQDESERSLTSTFTDYARSGEAFSVFLFHTVSYYCLAVLGFSFLVDRYPIIDSLYMASVTFTTIGFGDVHPTDVAGRIFLIILATYGIVILGIFLGVLGDIIIESQNTVTVERKRKLQRLVIGTIGRREGTRGAHLHPPFEPPVPLYKDITCLIFLEAPVILPVLFFGILIGYYEGWELTDSVYWTVVSSYTIGFGDFAPKTTLGRLCCILFLPFAVAVIGEVLGRIASVYMDRKRNQAEEIFLQRSLTTTDLRSLDLNADGRVTKSEFLTYMLVALQKVSLEDIEELYAVFDRLDVDSSGTLTQRDVETSPTAA